MQVENLLHIKETQTEFLQWGQSIPVCFRGMWANLRWDAGQVGWKMPLHPVLPLAMLCCQKGPFLSHFGHLCRRGFTLHPWTGSLHPPMCHFVLPMLLRARCGQRPDSFWHPSLDSVCSCCIFLFAGLFGHALVHSRHSGSNVSLFPIRKGARIWGGWEGGLSSSF